MTQTRAVLVLACLACGVAALLSGFALDWDLLNYHLYNPHALVTGRHAVDMAPAQQQTFLNPALYLPIYFLFQHGGNLAMVFVIAAIQGGQLLLLIRILEELTGLQLRQRRVLYAVAVLGLTGPIFLSQLGGSQGDTLLSAFVLAGLLTLLRDMRRSDASASFRAGLISGLLLGMACGLKLTFAVYALGLALACLACFPGSRRWRIVSGLAIGGLLGVLLTAGAWFLHLWLTWGNPLFPYFNDFFASPWIDQSSYRDPRFLPRTIAEWLFYPGFWLVDPGRVWELEFRDLRVPLAVAIAFLAPLFAWRRMRIGAPSLGLAWLFTAFSYVIWLWLFSIYRYLSVLELLAPLLVFATLFLYLRSNRSVILITLGLIATQVFVTHERFPASWEFEPETATALSGLPANAMVLIDGYQPVAYTALWLDDGIAMVRIRSNIMNSTEPRHRLHALAHQMVRNHGGPHYLLLPESDQEAAFIADDLALLGLEFPGSESCGPVFESEGLQKRLRLLLCPLRRLDGSNQPDADSLDGDSPDGDSLDGDSPDGDSSDGDSSDGDASDA